MATTSTIEPTRPVCSYCQEPAQLVTGESIYPHRPDLVEKYFWQCAPCDAYVGTHAGSRMPLGSLANAALRRAGRKLHDEVIDPLWRSAPECGAYDIASGDGRAVKKILKSARVRVYRFLGARLGCRSMRRMLGCSLWSSAVRLVRPAKGSPTGNDVLKSLAVWAVREWCEEQKKRQDETTSSR